MSGTRTHRFSLPFRLALFALGLLVAAALALRGVMKTRWFHGFIARQIELQVEQATGARVAIASLNIHLMRLTLRGLTLKGREPASAPPLLAARSISVRINPWSLIKRRLLISSLSAEGVRIHIITFPDGSTNVPGTTGSARSAVHDLLNLSIGALDLRRADLYWNNQRIPLDLTARRVMLLLRFSPQRGYWGSFSVSPLEIRAHRVPAVPVTFSTRLRLSERELLLSQFVWRALGITGEGTARLGWMPGFEGKATVHASGSLQVLARTLRFNRIRGGQFQGLCNLTYRRGRWAAHGNFKAGDIQIHAPTYAINRAEVSSDFSGEANGIRLSNLRISALGGSIVGHGEVLFMAREPRYLFDVLLQGFDMDRSLRALSGGRELISLLGFDSEIGGTAQGGWSGSFKQFHTVFHLQLKRPGYVERGRHPLAGGIQGSAQVAPGLVLKINAAKLETPYSSLDARGNLGANEPGLRVKYVTVDFKDSGPLICRLLGIKQVIPLELNSPLIFQGSATGPASSPEIRGTVRLGQFNLRGWSWSQFTASLDASAERLEVKSAKLQSGPSQLGFEGTLGLTDWQVMPNAPMTLAIRAARSPLRGLEDAVNSHFPLSGLATGHLKLAGTLSKVEGSGSFRVVSGTIGGEPFDLFSTDARVVQSVWYFQNALLKKGSGRMTGSAQLDWARRAYSVDFQGKGFSLAQFKTLQFKRANSPGSTRPPSVAGTANFQLRGQGTLSEPGLQLALDVRNIQLNETKAGNLQSNFALRGKELHGQASLQGPAGGSLHVALATRLQGKWPSTVKGEFTDLRPDRWIKSFGTGPSWAIPISASGSFEGSGPLRQPALFSLDAQVRTLTLSAPGLVLKNDRTVNIHLKDESLESSPFRLRGPFTNVAVEASARFLKPRAFSIGLQGDAQAAALKLLDPSLQAVGAFHLNVRASGTWQQPALRGEIDVKNLSIQFAKTPLALAELNGKIVLNGNRASIVSLTGASGETSVLLSGYATLTPLFYSIQARLQNVRYEFPPDFNTLLNGHLLLTGSPRGGELSGSIAIGQMFVSPDFNLAKWVGEVGSSMISVPVGGGSPSGPSIRLNVRVHSSPDVRMNSRTLSFAAIIDARLRGTVDHPVPTGDIRFESGQALLQGNRYDILRGDIAWSGRGSLVPTLDIEAQTHVQRYNLMVTVDGPADHLRLAYRSNPPLPSEDVLSLLALGYAPQQQMMASTGNPTFGAVGASALLSQALSSQVSGRVQSLFGITRISIDPNVLGATTAGGVRVTIEKQVSHNVTVTYSTNTGAQQQQDVRLRWDLTPKISLIGERDINGVYSVEIQFNRTLFK